MKNGYPWATLFQNQKSNTKKLIGNGFYVCGQGDIYISHKSSDESIFVAKVNFDPWP
jgi:hypothetical protein